jgi:hypothetical protein
MTLTGTLLVAGVGVGTMRNLRKVFPQGGPKKCPRSIFQMKGDKLRTTFNCLWWRFSNKLATEVQEMVSRSMSFAFNSIPHSFEILARDTFLGHPVVHPLHVETTYAYQLWHCDKNTITKTITAYGE